jgi:hypothetical protein
MFKAGNYRRNLKRNNMKGFKKMYIVFKTEEGRIWKIETALIPKEDVEHWRSKGPYQLKKDIKPLKIYSEQEVFNLLMEFSSQDTNSSSRTPHSVANWFEKFKKK